MTYILYFFVWYSRFLGQWVSKCLIPTPIPHVLVLLNKRLSNTITYFVRKTQNTFIYHENLHEAKMTHTCKSHKMFPIVRSLEKLTLTLGTGASILAVLRCFLLILSSRRDLIGGLGWTGVRAPPELGVVGVRVRVESLLVGVVGVWLPKLLGLKSEEWCFDRVKFLMGSSGGGLLISW